MRQFVQRAVLGLGILCGGASPVLGHDDPDLVPVRITLAKAEVSGTLMLPHLAPGDKVPCVVILGGTLSDTRDGRMDRADAPPRDALKRLAEALVVGGYASLRYDKVGHGESRPHEGWRGTYTEESEVAAAAIQWARRQPQVSRVIVAGESAGAYLGCLAAKQGVTADAYVFLGPLCGSAEEMAAAGHALARRQEVPQLPPDAMFQHIMAPALVLAGERDLSVPPAHAARAVEIMRKAGNKNATRRLIPGADHNFQQTADNEEERLRERHSLTSVRRPYEPAFYKELLTWLHITMPTPAEGTTRVRRASASRATRLNQAAAAN